MSTSGRSHFTPLTFAPFSRRGQRLTSQFSAAAFCQDAIFVGFRVWTGFPNLFRIRFTVKRHWSRRINNRWEARTWKSSTTCRTLHTWTSKSSPFCSDASRQQFGLDSVKTNYRNQKSSVPTPAGMSASCVPRWTPRNHKGEIDSTCAAKKNTEIETSKKGVTQ